MKNRYKELVQEKADLVKEASGIFDLVETEGRDLSEEEMARDDAINGRLKAVATQLEREERRREWERSVAVLPDANMTIARQAVESIKPQIELDPMGGFKSVAEFALAVRDACMPGGGRVDERLLFRGDAPTNFHQETDTGEGYMVAPQMRAEVWDIVWMQDSLLAMVDSEPTAGNYVEFAKDETTPWGASGIIARWRAEGTKMEASKLVTEAEQMKLHELYAFVTATEELLADAPRLNNRLTRKSGEAIRWKINEALVDGTGAGQPLGWVTSNAKVTVAKESGQAAATVVADNVAKMFARLINPGQGIWFVNQDVLPQLITMTLGDKPIWIPPSQSFQDAPGGFLFGRPVRILENCETLGTAGDIQFVNPRGYYAITKTAGLEFASSIHLFFDFNLQAFRWIFRINGQPFMSAPVSPAKGSKTRSHFVLLATRA